MRRYHLIELHEQQWMPAFIRDAVVESLNQIVRRRRTVRGLVGPFREFLRRSGASWVLDLCSGAGGPAITLAEELRREGGEAPRMVLSDLFPRVHIWRESHQVANLPVEYWPRPVDATHVDAELSRGSSRMINNAFHHFSPETAKAILKDAMEHSSGIFLSEVYPRSLLRYFHFVWPNFFIVSALPVITTRHRLAKAILTWLLPVIPLVIVWDGLVSMLRMYTEAELRQLVAPLGDRFEWTYGTGRYPPCGRMTYFYGVPRRGR